MKEATVKSIDSFMSEIADKRLSEPWDNDGIMLCGNTEREVKRAVVCLEISDSAVEFALSCNADCIVTHHPYIFHPLKSVTSSVYSKLEKLMAGGISVLSYHTRLDCANGGVNDCLASCLSLESVSAFAAEEGGFAMGRVGNLPFEMSADKFAVYVEGKLHSVGLRYCSPEGKLIKRVAVLGGAGKDFLHGAVKSDADAFVSADLSHNIFLDGVSMGIAVVDAGHYSTENPVVSHIAKLLRNKFDFDVLEYDVGSPYKGI